MYRCVCDWLGLPYREEVQWVSISIFNHIHKVHETFHHD